MPLRVCEACDRYFIVAKTARPNRPCPRCHVPTRRASLEEASAYLRRKASFPALGVKGGGVKDPTTDD